MATKQVINECFPLSTCNHAPLQDPCHLLLQQNTHREHHGQIEFEPTTHLSKLSITLHLL